MTAPCLTSRRQERITTDALPGVLGCVSHRQKIKMADVAIPAEHWHVLRRSANCFIPKLVQAATSTSRGFKNTVLHQAGLTKGLSGFSLHVVGNVLGRKAVTHEKAQQFLDAYTMMPQEIRDEHGEILEHDIVAAFLGIPGIKDHMLDAKLGVEELANASGVSATAIQYAMRGRRVTGGIAGALHAALIGHGAKCPALAEFASSNPVETIGKKAVDGAPFGLRDLLLPSPIVPPASWG